MSTGFFGGKLSDQSGPYLVAILHYWKDTSDQKTIQLRQKSASRLEMGRVVERETSTLCSSWKKTRRSVRGCPLNKNRVAPGRGKLLNKIGVELGRTSKALLYKREQWGSNAPGVAAYAA